MSVTEEIKARLDLVAFVQDYVPLKKAGRNYKGACPFHSDRTPSFVVFPDSHTWRCFGACAEGGDIFSFLMKQEGLTFSEALAQLAPRAGVELAPPSPERQAQSESQDRLRGLLGLASEYFHDNLLNAPQAEYARQYAHERGLSAETLASFQVGYALDSWDAMRQVLLAAGYTIEDLLDAGLLVEKDGGDVYDRFRDRLVIPIRDARGHVIGFGARALKPDAVPKYLNSPQTVLFDKSSVLFGLSHARRAIRESDTVVIVEGYVDVMQAQQAGFENVVAQMGTALTESQLKALRRYATRFILALDSDLAGAQATMRGLDTARATLDKQVRPTFDAHGMVTYEGHLDAEIRVLLVPEGMDPDDVIRESPDHWRALVDDAMPVTEYAIRVATQGRDLDDPKVKKQIVRDVSPLIDDIADATERDHYRQRLARLLKIDERVLMLASAGTAIRATVRSRRKPEDDAVQSEVTAPDEWYDLRDVAHPREARCLATLVHVPGLVFKADRLIKKVATWPQQGQWDALAAFDFGQPEHQVIFRTWRGALAQAEQAPVDFILGVLDESLRLHLDALLESYPRDILDAGRNRVEDEILRFVLELRGRRLHAELQKVAYLSQDAHENGDLRATAYDSMIVELLSAKSNLTRVEAEFLTASRRMADAIAI